MRQRCKVGDLVHIPQAVQLVECDTPLEQVTRQLTIPLSVKITDAPQPGVVTAVGDPGLCVRVYSEGSHWTVKKESIYALKGGKET